MARFLASSRHSCALISPHMIAWQREILEAFAASGGISVGIGQCAEDSVEYRTKRLSVKGSELTVRVSDMQGQSNKSKTSEALTEAPGVMLVYDAQVAENWSTPEVILRPDEEDDRWVQDPGQRSERPPPSIHEL